MKGFCTDNRNVLCISLMKGRPPMRWHWEMCAEALAAFAKHDCKTMDTHAHHYKEHKNEKNPQFKCFHQQLTKAGLECMHFLKYYRKCWSWLLFKFTNTTSVFDSALQLKLAGSFWLDFPECFLAMSKNNVLFCISSTTCQFNKLQLFNFLE